jgi:excinuclease UvrABC nuclease subunit
MTLWTPEAIDAAPGFFDLDRRLAQVPDRRAVFLIAPRQGAPYIGRTALLRRRLERLLGERSQPSRLLSLRSVAARVEFQLTASWLETSLVFYEVARAHFPEDYPIRIKLRMPPYVKILLSNRFPRSQVTTRLDASHALYYGPFRTRASADQFEDRFLDLFQMRRCHEDLEPSPDHPGCVYGEMNLCLRPCQQAVGAQEYASEIERVVRFLSTGGRSLLDTASHARERACEETDFELAARLHKQVEKIEGVLKLRDNLVSEVGRLCGVAVTPSVAAGCVELWFMLEGRWLPPVRFPVHAVGEKAVSLDARLRSLVGGFEPRRLVARERQEHLALLARWYYSGSRDGEWLPFAALSDLPYRRLVRAISRTAAAGGSACPTHYPRP